MADTKYNSIRPGELWLDTDGNPIQAHGGGIIYINVFIGTAKIKKNQNRAAVYGTGA